MGDTTWPKDTTKTHSEAASKSQLRAAQTRAWRRSWRSRISTSSRSASFCTNEETVSGLTSGRWLASRCSRSAAWCLPWVSRTTVPANRPMQDHPEDGRVAVERVVAVERDRHQQGQPEQGVEHDGGTDPLGGQTEGGGAAGNAQVGEEAVGERRARGGAAGQHVADGQARHVDPEQFGAVGGARREHRVGQFGVRHQRDDLQEDGDDEPDVVDVVDLVEGPSGTGELGEHHIDDDEEQDDDNDRPLDLTGDPSATPGTTGARLRGGLRDGRADGRAVGADGGGPIGDAACDLVDRRNEAVPGGASHPGLRVGRARGAGIGLGLLAGSRPPASAAVGGPAVGDGEPSMLGEPSLTGDPPGPAPVPDPGSCTTGSPLVSSVIGPHACTSVGHRPAMLWTCRGRREVRTRAPAFPRPGRRTPSRRCWWTTAVTPGGPGCWCPPKPAASRSPRS